MLSKHVEQQERLDVIENEKRLRGSSSGTPATFLSHTHNDIGGRYAAISSPQVVGSTPLPRYEGAPNWASDPVGQEPSLGYAINAQEPSVLPANSGDPASGEHASPPPLAERAGVGSFPLFRRF